jgi:hypothetical protein
VIHIQRDAIIVREVELKNAVRRHPAPRLFYLRIRPPFIHNRLRQPLVWVSDDDGHPHGVLVSVTEVSCRDVAYHFGWRPLCLRLTTFEPHGFQSL